MKNVKSVEQMLCEFESKTVISEEECKRQFAKEFLGIELETDLEDEAQSTWEDEEELMFEIFKEFGCCFCLAEE